MLKEFNHVDGWKIRYVPSNHPNLAYQRYLGYLASKDHELLVYLDDDLRISDADAFSKLLSPLMNPVSGFVAGTAVIRFPEEIGAIGGAVRDRIQDSRQVPSLLVKWLGASASTAPGGLTPLGNRVPPDPRGAAYSEVEWLRGGVMVFRVNVLSEKFFSDDLFALTYVRCGLGEDTFLGRRALSYGKLFIANECVIDHPNADVPKAYPTQAFRMGLATAYSRRFINDTYRGFNPPTFADRKALIKGLIGGTVLALLRALKSPSRHRFSYAVGYIYGTLRAFLFPPIAHRLAPGVDWRGDARSVTLKMESI
jgi:glycosyltransferase involved in cell wall biosynthesis